MILSLQSYFFFVTCEWHNQPTWDCHVKKRFPPLELTFIFFCHRFFSVVFFSERTLPTIKEETMKSRTNGSVCLYVHSPYSGFCKTIPALWILWITRKHIASINKCEQKEIVEMAPVKTQVLCASVKHFFQQMQYLIKEDTDHARIIYTAYLNTCDGKQYVYKHTHNLL